MSDHRIAKNSHASSSVDAYPVGELNDAIGQLNLRHQTTDMMSNAEKALDTNKSTADRIGAASTLGGEIQSALAGKGSLKAIVEMMHNDRGFSHLQDIVLTNDNSVSFKSQSGTLDCTVKGKLNFTTCEVRADAADAK